MSDELRRRPRPERAWGDPGSMAQPRPRRRKVDCIDFVERITDYLDDAIPDRDRAAIDRHLAACADCTRALEQWRTVVALTGRLGEEVVDDLDPSTREDLLVAFRAQRPAPD
jgi:anti-sigma factor RsiW